jgi:hypothetical protein
MIERRDQAAEEDGQQAQMNSCTKWAMSANLQHDVKISELSELGARSAWRARRRKGDPKSLPGAERRDAAETLTTTVQAFIRRVDFFHLVFQKQVVLAFSCEDVVPPPSSLPVLTNDANAKCYMFLFTPVTY